MPPAFAVLTADLLLVIIDELLVIFGPVGFLARLALLFYQIRRGKSSVGGCAGAYPGGGWGGGGVG
jgi:hypothetical protein